MLELFPICLAELKELGYEPDGKIIPVREPYDGMCFCKGEDDAEGNLCYRIHISSEYFCFNLPDFIPKSIIIHELLHANEWMPFKQSLNHIGVYKEWSDKVEAAHPDYRVMSSQLYFHWDHYVPEAACMAFRKETWDPDDHSRLDRKYILYYPNTACRYGGECDHSHGRFTRLTSEELEALKMRTGN